MNRKLNRKLNKKSFLYSFIAILFILLLVISFADVGNSRLKENTYLVSNLVLSIDNKLSVATNDIQRGMGIVGFRALVSMDDIMITSGEYLLDVDSMFSEIFLNGTYRNVTVDMMNGTTFENFVNALETAFSFDNLALNISANDVRIQHSDPWHIEILLNVSIYLSDAIGTASWNQDFIVSQEVSVIDLSDAIYHVETNGFAGNQIHITNLSGFGNDTANLLVHLNNSFYIASDTAPSYMMRLEGDLSSDPNGIESLVNVEELILQGIPALNRSSVDYIYFGEGFVNHSGVQSMPLWFRLDESHQDTYGVGDLLEI